MADTSPAPGRWRPLATARHFAGDVRVRFRDWWRGETAATFFDVYNPAERTALLSAHGLPPAETLPVADAGLKVARRVWEIRDDLRAAFPLGLTPAQRRVYAGWLLTHGKADFGLTRDAVLAYLRELADDPSHGLAASFLWQPEWQKAVPHALTRFGWTDFTQ